MCSSDLNNKYNPNQIQKDHYLPLFIVQGVDSFLDIGDPKVIDKGTNKDLLQLWEDSFYSMYPKNQMPAE